MVTREGAATECRPIGYGCAMFKVNGHARRGGHGVPPLQLRNSKTEPGFDELEIELQRQLHHARITRQGRDSANGGAVNVSLG